MNLHWAAQYIGLPYKIGGNDRAGIDCWGLVRLVLAEQRGIIMPELSVRSTDNDNEANIKRCFVGWSKSDGKSEFDIITMRNAFGHHVGIVARADDWETWVLHCDEPHSTAANIATLRLLGYRDFRSWRHER